MMRKPVVWIVLVVISAACAVFTLHGFPRAFPLVTLDLRMDREAALEAAQELAEQHNWGPQQYRQATAFVLDDAVQRYVELEAGGTEAFARLLKTQDYVPYVWQVRHFAEGQTNETLIRFTPQGVAYGFVEKLAEGEPGETLDREEARVLAEKHASSWGVDLGAYTLIESSQELQPGGRLDHTVVYERSNKSLGDALYRLRLVISGDRFTELSHFVKIPEGFERRYTEMRSANRGIKAGASVVILIVYLVGGCGVGLFFLLRMRWVVWRPAVLWAGVIAMLGALAQLNQWPLIWMSYDTAVPQRTFALQQLVGILVQSIAMGALLAVSFIAAESLSRLAFPEHLQLWKLWRRDVAGTSSVAGRTISGYLLVTVFFALEVAFYFVCTRYLGWWSPSDALFDPNVLATYFPWLNSIALSFQAGFWEECLFRAVPLAAAALLGRRFGRPKLWIIGALLMQAVVFGAGHADYPTQPAYARMVELLLPSLGLGLLYLRFGLLPSIVLHFAYDVVWMSLPLFTASSPGVWINQLLIVALALIPLWVVLWARMRRTSWGPADSTAYNAAWTPKPAGAVPVEIDARLRSEGLSRRARAVVLGAGVGGLVLWLVASSFTSDVPAVTMSREVASRAAEQALATQGTTLDSSWHEVSFVSASPAAADRFVWQEGGPQAYRQLVGTYVHAPHWMIRHLRFEGDVAERAEEYQVHVGDHGTPTLVVHTLPEGRAGARLEQAAARDLAHLAVKQRLGIDPEILTEVTAEPSKLPARRDWSFVFKDETAYPLQRGEARIAVDIAGDEVVSSERYVYPPEDWRRQERHRSSLAQIVRSLSLTTLVLLYVAGVMVALVEWSRHRFATRAFLGMSGALVLLGAVRLLNAWPATKAALTSAEPYKLQVGIMSITGMVQVLVVACAVGLLTGMGHRWGGGKHCSHPWSLLVTGLALGGFIAGMGAAASALVPQPLPAWPSFEAASTALPMLGVVVGTLSGWIMQTVLLLLVFSVMHMATQGWNKNRVTWLALVLLLGLVLAGTHSIETVPYWLAQGVAIGVAVLAVYVLVLRHCLVVLPLASGAVAALETVRQGVLRAFPGALTGAICATLFLLVGAVGWFVWLSKEPGLFDEVTQGQDEESGSAATA